MMHLHVIRLLALSLSLGATGILHATPIQSWRFAVYLDEREIGQHRFSLAPRTDGTHVAIDARFTVKFLFINAYEYAHQNYEVWRDECLHSIHAQTDDNGDIHFVQGARSGDKLRLLTHDGEQQLQGCVRTFAYWDPAILDSTHLLNAQTGELLPVSIESLGMVVIQVRDKQLLANHYRLVTDKFSIELWYAADTREWVSLRTTLADGNTLHYRLL